MGVLLFSFERFVVSTSVLKIENQSAYYEFSQPSLSQTRNNYSIRTLTSPRSLFLFFLSIYR